MVKTERRLKSGDLIATANSGLVSGVINLTTGALPLRGASHVAMVLMNGPQAEVWESTSTEAGGRPPCKYLGQIVHGVQAHDWEDYLEFAGDRVWHYPLRAELYPEEEARLRRLVESSLGMRYDTVGAVRSGGFAFRVFQAVLREEDLSTVFCSEWLADLEVKIGRMHTRNVSSWSPNRLCRYMVRRGYSDKPRRVK